MVKYSVMKLKEKLVCLIRDIRLLVFGKMVKALQIVGPILTAGSSMLMPDVEKSLKFMTELTKPFHEKNQNHDNQQASQFLRRILMEQDPNGERWGLQRVITKEGHIYWVCPIHKAQFDAHEKFHALG